MKTMNYMVLGSVVAFASTAGADVIGFESFDGGAVNLNSTSNVFDYNSGGGAGGDLFGVTGPFASGSGLGGPFDVWDDSVTDTSGGGVFPDDSLAIAGQNTSLFFGMVDPDGIDSGNLNNAVWRFDITSAITLDNIQIDMAAMGDWEAGSTDGFLIEAQIDGGGWIEIFKARTNEDISHTYRAFDDGDVFSLNDPLELFIDGSTDAFGVLDKSDPDTGNFDTYTSLALAGMNGTELEIRVSWAGSPSGSEAAGIDNITINGTIPAPGALALLGVAGLVGRRRRRH